MKTFDWKLVILLAVPWLPTVNSPGSSTPFKLNGSEFRDGAIVVNDPTGLGSPVRTRVLLDERLLKPALEGKIHLIEKRNDQNDPSPVAVQYEQRDDVEKGGFLCLQMPPGKKGRREFALKEGRTAAPKTMVAHEDETSGQLEITESGQPVLRYVYQTNEPGNVLEAIHPNNQKYARARSNYIHPLYGPDGDVLTKDWAVDHPHHRGIYWAWPETSYREENGDLHALQRVFARPTGHYRLTQGPVYAQIEAENQWLWDDEEAIVREKAIFRAYALGPEGRCIDLKFIFTALNDGVTIARRGTDQYGGLNIRLAETTQQEILFHTDPVQATPRIAWADFLGVFGEGRSQTAFAVLQRQSNPEHPGEWVKYPDIQWFQPTFPTAGTRYELKKGQPLTLQYRFWIRSGGRAAESIYADQWRAYHHLGGL